MSGLYKCQVSTKVYSIQMSGRYKWLVNTNDRSIQMNGQYKCLVCTNVWSIQMSGLYKSLVFKKRSGLFKCLVYTNIWSIRCQVHSNVWSIQISSLYKCQVHTTGINNEWSIQMSGLQKCNFPSSWSIQNTDVVFKILKWTKLTMQLDYRLCFSFSTGWVLEKRRKLRRALPSPSWVLVVGQIISCMTKKL